LFVRLFRLIGFLFAFRVCRGSLSYTDQRRSQQAILEEITLLINLEDVPFVMFVRLDTAHCLVDVWVELMSERVHLTEPRLDEYVAKLSASDLYAFTETILLGRIGSLDSSLQVVEHWKDFRNQLSSRVVDEVGAFTLYSLAEVLELGLFASNQVANVLELFG
jgi:hypothetical protein